jgi:4-hydroxy-tetrahydrodipicolinate reductase
MIKVALSGSTGRMGQVFEKLILESEKFSLSNVYNKNSALESWTAEDIDVVIDFSLPEALKKVCKWCNTHQKPLITGTTGFEDIKDVIDISSLKTAVVHSGNYSLGIASLIESLKSYKVFSHSAHIWIEDYHHENKKDSPSGTALKISEALKDHTDKAVKINDVRAGSIFGIHKVHMATKEEWITLTHRALNRDVFAKGALELAGWIKEKAPALYTLEDFLNDEVHKN